MEKRKRGQKRKREKKREGKRKREKESNRWQECIQSHPEAVRELCKDVNKCKRHWVLL